MHTCKHARAHTHTNTPLLIRSLKNTERNKGRKTGTGIKRMGDRETGWAHVPLRTRASLTCRPPLGRHEGSGPDGMMVSVRCVTWEVCVVGYRCVCAVRGIWWDRDSESCVCIRIEMTPSKPGACAAGGVTVCTCVCVCVRA